MFTEIEAALHILDDAALHATSEDERIAYRVERRALSVAGAMYASRLADDIGRMYNEWRNPLMIIQRTVDFNESMSSESDEDALLRLEALGRE